MWKYSKRQSYNISFFLSMWSDGWMVIALGYGWESEGSNLYLDLLIIWCW
jgi:hypothetical protein